MGILIIRKTQEEIWPHRSQYHVLTYAEEGFSEFRHTGLNWHQRQHGAPS